MQKIRYILFFLLASSFLYSQENNFKTIVGEVINDTIDISGIHVINSTSGAKTITDNKGFFKVGVRENDSIFFTSVQIKTQLIISNRPLTIWHREITSDRQSWRLRRPDALPAWASTNR